MPEEWKLTAKDQRNEGPYWIQATDTGSKDEFWWFANVKWDGCIEIGRRFNSPAEKADGQDYDQLHLCDLDQFIERLQALRALAARELGPRHGLYES